ncbi:MarR family winged helix-turn-helix transcriptional regulator [Streptomyces sp. NPDC048290]|uniref:MarR family winged helix-turn-helix transcriptional regulator n=1 Tax=Streptomyces sp. NPDC048290 TaxID=3155811 RepID=UPI00342FB67D
MGTSEGTSEVSATVPPGPGTDWVPAPGTGGSTARSERPLPSPATGAECASDAELAGRLRMAIQHLGPLLRGGQRTDPGLTPSRLAALSVLDEVSPVRIGELAARTGITLSTASRMVDLLVAAGWVGRAPDPKDQRASLLSLTGAGRSVLRAARTEITGALAREIALLDEGPRGLLREALPALEALARQARLRPPEGRG